MYLLMLLATFMSAIYGYNLSARPDYDRDVVKKKAMAIIYRFTFQHATSRRLIQDLMKGRYEVDGIVKGNMLSGSYIATNNGHNTDSTDNAGIHTYYVEDGADEVFIPLRIFDLNNHLNSVPNGGPRDYLPVGRTFYNGDEMVSKFICITEDLDKDTSKECEETRDPDNHSLVMAGCCNDPEKPHIVRYVLSYKKVDPRWINRITGKISVDFIKALTRKDFSDNIGIINWDGTNWIFNGKISLPAVYAKDKENWEKIPENKDKNYPRELSNRTYWKLPNTVFKADFFVGRAGANVDKNFCKGGCIFRIQGI